jgi:salicylate hydroxylase
LSGRTALIAGGGIGGLAVAIALGKAGFQCTILERRPHVSEAGAGIQIGPNGTRLLHDLGVAGHLMPDVGVPQAIAVRDGRSGATLSTLPLGDWIAARHAAPYWTAHRADLHAALLATVEASNRVQITSGFEIASVGQTAQSVTVTTADGRQARGDILVGADGIGSAVRRSVFGEFELRPSGLVAVRAVVAASPATSQAVGVWLAPRAHVVHYPVRAGREIAVVVVSQGAAALDGWNTSVDGASVLAKVADLDPSLLDLLQRAQDLRQWTLATTRPLQTWSMGRVVLAGDATGPILPFLAQGAVMALEDAERLASALSATADHTRAFAAYEAARRPRRARVATTAARNGRIYHLEGALAVARNMMLRALSGERVMSGYDWLYGYREP